jgi:transposase
MKKPTTRARNGPDNSHQKQPERRYQVLHEVELGRMTLTEAADILGLSYRQAHRLMKAFKQDGIDGLRNKSVGQPGHHACDPALKEEVIFLAKEEYPDAGPTFLAELLKERHGIEVSRETLRQWLQEAGIREAKESKPRHRRRRQRKPSLGVMVQMDTCTHDWFRNDKKAYLIILIDDATSMVYGKFYDSDSTLSNMDAIKNYIQLHGRPIALYTDNASHFRVNKGEKSEDVISPHDKTKTQIERALGQCGISHIHALSPQAKGRVERNFNTLQDRLEKSLFYDKIKDIDSANTYLKTVSLDSYNKKFMVAPTADFDSHQPVGGLDLDAIFSIQVERVCTNDFTFSLNSRKYQIAKENDLYGLPRRRVLIEKRLDGSIKAKFKDRYLVIHGLSETDKH